MSRSRILCVEDDPEISDLLTEVLAEEGFSITVAASGPEGLAGLAERPDAVVCDIDLPGFSGLDLVRRGRETLGRLPPVIFLTAFGGRGNQIEARRLGCDDFVTKPVDFELLIAVLHNVLQRTPARAADPAAEGAPAVLLTAREREILTWVSRGKSSAEIAQIVGVSERTANFHIGRVMRKLDVTSRTQAAVMCQSLRLLEP